MKVLHPGNQPNPPPILYKDRQRFQPFRVTCHSCRAHLEVDDVEEIKYGSRFIGYGDDWSFFLYVVCPECDARRHVESYNNPGDPTREDGPVLEINRQCAIPDYRRYAAWSDWVRNLYPLDGGEYSGAAGWERFLNHPDIKGWAQSHPRMVAEMRQKAGLS